MVKQALVTTYNYKLLEALALTEEGVDLGLGGSVHQETVLVNWKERK